MEASMNSRLLHNVPSGLKISLALTANHFLLDRPSTKFHPGLFLDSEVTLQSLGVLPKFITAIPGLDSSKSNYRKNN